MGARMGVLAGLLCALSIAVPASASTLLHTWAADDTPNDSTGTNDGAWVGTAAYTPGAVNDAFSFDGTKYVSVPDDPSHYPSGSFTVDLFAKSSVATGHQMFFSIYECGNSCPSGHATSAIDIELLDGIPNGFVRDSDATALGGVGQEIAGGPPLADGALHHYVLVRDVAAGRLALYVDGTEVADDNLQPDAAGPLGNDDGEPDPLTIGAYIIGGTATPNGLVNGAVDEVKFYDGTQYPDTTPPVVTPTVTGQAQNGWLGAAGQVSWTVTDESILRTKQGCDPTSVSSDTASQTLTCTASSAGGLTSQPVTVKRDATEPTVSCPSPAPSFGQGAAGKTITATVADALSGPAAATVSGAADTSTAGAKVVSLTGSDVAGNQQTVSCAYTVVAPTKQEIALSTAPPSKVAGAFGLPAAKSCVSRRRFAVHIRRPTGVTIATVNVTLNGKPVKTRKVAGKFTATVDLRGLKKGAYTLAIRVTTASGKTLKGNRRYHTCASRRKGGAFHAPL